MPDSRTDSGESCWPWSTPQTRASQPSWGVQGGVVILFFEVIGMAIETTMKIVLFFSMLLL